MYKCSPHYKYTFLMVILKHTNRADSSPTIQISTRKDKDFDKERLIGDRLLYPIQNITKERGNKI